MDEGVVSVRYMVDDVDTAVAFYTAHFGFTVISNSAPAFADVLRGQLDCCSAALEVRPGGPCQMGVSQCPEVGTESISSCLIWPLR